MTVLQKFMFDRSFDSPDAARRRRTAEQAPTRAAEAPGAAETPGETGGPAAEPETPAAPGFSEDDIAAARAQGYQDGKQAGNQEAWTQFRTQTDQMAVRALKVIGEKMQALVDDVQVSNQTAYRDAVTLSVAVVQKLFPILADRGGVDEVEAVIADCLRRLHPEPRVVIKVNGYIAEALQDRLEPLIDELNFTGQLVLEINDDLAQTDCAVSWAGGGAARNGAAMWAAINAAFQEVLGIDAVALRDSDPIAGHQQVDGAPADPSSGTAPAPEMIAVDDAAGDDAAGDDATGDDAAGQEDLAPDLLQDHDGPAPRDESAPPDAGPPGAPDDDLDLEEVP